jgi:hypothetical protein
VNEVMQRILSDRRERIANERLAAERLRAERRERIATACLAGMIANPECSGKFEDYANDSVKYADALIARLDKEAKP